MHRFINQTKKVFNEKVSRRHDSSISQLNAFSYYKRLKGVEDVRIMKLRRGAAGSLVLLFEITVRYYPVIPNNYQGI
jgi:hypothetical protein